MVSWLLSVEYVQSHCAVRAVKIEVCTIRRKWTDTEIFRQARRQNLPAFRGLTNLCSLSGTPSVVPIDALPSPIVRAPKDQKDEVLDGSDDRLYMR